MRGVVTAAAMILGACSGDVELEAGGGLTTDCTGAETFVAGMSATTEDGTVVRIMEATPSPPDVGDNAWVVEVERDGVGVDGLDVQVRPWMPLHGHGLAPARYASTSDGAGQYTVDTFDVIMPGLWEFYVTLSTGDTGEEVQEAMFPLCAEG